ncbi:hypothetical protein CH294_10730 [Rhodococcus sp. 14-2483-1-1]|nr:hypothetical protein CH286_09700 [Rhodococcus sp. WWJCD1]OZE81494.1 hypothetical protein CH305_09665 [Rhodococcus sp. 15-649-2-2]OZF36857.1 hypothetical protein CH294_10730 [Rhodococcus sp. 14-2483-1-1]
MSGHERVTGLRRIDLDAKMSYLNRVTAVVLRAICAKDVYANDLYGRSTDMMNLRDQALIA